MKIYLLGFASLIAVMLVAGCGKETCTLVENADGSTTLVCPDGTEVTIPAARDCTLVENADGSATLSCSDGTDVTITPARDGTDGVSTLVTAQEIGPEDSGHGCEHGGQWIISCVDNGSGECVEGSETRIPICHGNAGETGSDITTLIEPLKWDDEGHSCGIDGGYWLVTCVSDGNGACEEDTETKVPVCHGDRIYGGDLTIDSKCQLKDLDNYDVIAGELRIRNITDVEEIHLPHLKSVGKKFELEYIDDLKVFTAEKLSSAGRCMYVQYNGVLETVSFPRLASTGRSVWIRNNPLLDEVSMPVLESTGRGFWMSQNGGLTNLHMPSLTKTGRGLWIHENSSLKTVSFPELVNTGSSFRIYSNDVLESIDFPKFSGTSSSMWIYENPLLLAVSFPSLEGVGSQRDKDCEDEPRNAGGLSIYRNAKLGSISLPELRYTFGRLDVYENAELTSLDTPKLEDVGVRTDTNNCRHMRLRNNDSLQSFEFPMLSAIGGTLTVADNDELLEFAFPALDTIGQDLVVDSNLLLESFSFDALTEVEGDFAVTNNPELPTELAADLAGAVTVGGETRIEFNKSE